MHDRFCLQNVASPIHVSLDKEQHFQSNNKVISNIQMNENSIYYFAYGSNMNPKVLSGMRKVKPKSQRPGILKGYRLSFTLLGAPGIEPSFASIEPDPSESVHGICFEVTRKQFFSICATEGVPISYSILNPVKIHGYDGTLMNAATLVIPKMSLFRTPFGIDIPPSKSYLQLIQEGAKSGGLDESWCQKLDNIEENRFAFFGGIAGAFVSKPK